ncbi:M10 family metallopeptidase C-terminal domain-containing protein [Durusdinium trenchii]|uniref:M10 family metallopeptidase C-terminal domain-containing protein n=1 Tax=Durusdinium trenchii TaxID=1381693 RepID=A0ABP0MUP6_9DINO
MARVAALQIAGEEIPKELIDAANQHSKPEEEQPIVWEGRGEQSCPLGAKEDRKRTRDGRDLDLPREGRRRRRGSRDRRESDQLRSQSRKRRRQQGEVPDAKKIARQVAENLLSEDRQGEEEDEVEAVPNTELFVLGSSESYSYEWEGDEEEIEKAKAAHAAEKHRIKEARKAEAERKAEEQRKAEEERKAEELRKLEEERKEAELKAEEARREAEAAEAKQKEEEVALVRSSSQETSRLQHSQYALPCDHPFLM